METIWQSRWTNCTDNVRTAAQEADHALACRNVADRVRYTVQVVVEELLSNSIKYAFEDDAEHGIELDLALSEDAVRITLVDRGRPFDPSCGPSSDSASEPVPMAPLTPTDGGMGILMVRHMAKSVAYRRDGERNVVQVDIALDSAQEGTQDSETDQDRSTL